MSAVKEEPPDGEDFDVHVPGGFTFVSCGTEYINNMQNNEESQYTAVEKITETELHDEVAIENGQHMAEGLWNKGDGNSCTLPGSNNIICYDSSLKQPIQGTQMVCNLERTEVIVVDVTARCKFCGKNVDCECHVRQPEQLHSEVKQYTCIMCKKTFVHNSDLEQHSSIYIESQGYQCDVCSKVFSNPNNIKSHKLTHSDRKIFYCDICNKVFLQSNQFSKHNLIHSRDKTYKCDVCDKNFNILSHLIDHKLNHVNTEMCQSDVCINSFDDLPTDEKSAIIFFQKKGILPPKRICRQGHDMKLYFGERLKWYCNIRTCRTKINMRVGNWFEGSKLPFLTALRFIYYWTEELTSIEWCRHQLDLANSTTVDWNNYLREVCVSAVEKQSMQKIGGKNLTVEVNLSMFSKRKNHVGYACFQQWIFGGICRETNDCFLVQVPDRSLQTVTSAITEYIKEGSTIYSDLWHSYYASARKDIFQDLRKNHSYNFIDYETETHTETIERLWGSDKWRNKKHRGIARHLLGSYLAEFLWRQQLRDSDPFETILQNIKDFRPPEILCKPKELNNT